MVGGESFVLYLEPYVTLLGHSQSSSLWARRPTSGESSGSSGA